MTTFKPSTNHAIVEVSEKKWIYGSNFHNSDDEESEDEHVKEHVNKLMEEEE